MRRRSRDGARGERSSSAEQLEQLLDQAPGVTGRGEVQVKNRSEMMYHGWMMRHLDPTCGVLGKTVLLFFQGPRVTGFPKKRSLRKRRNMKIRPEISIPGRSPEE